MGYLVVLSYLHSQMQGWYAIVSRKIDVGITPGKQDIEEIRVLLLPLGDVSMNGVVSIKTQEVRVIPTLQKLNQCLYT